MEKALPRLRAVREHLRPALAAADNEVATLPSSGLFIDDYSTLPRPTLDLQRAKDDIDQFGYCIVGPNVLPPDRVDWVMGRLMEQAEAEAREGVDAQGIHKNLEEANQSVKSLQNKGLTELLQHKDVLEVVGHVLGERFQTQVFSCEIHKPGGEAKALHSDQWWMPPPVHRNDATPRILSGSVDREMAHTTEWQSESPEFITPSVRCTAIWPITDLTADNGAT